MKKKRTIALVLAFLLAGILILFAADNDVTMSQFDGASNKPVTVAAVANGVLGFDGSSNLVAKTTGLLTPWVADIDADGFDLRDLSNLEFRTTTGAPAGTVQAIWADAGGINLNVPTADLFDFLVNGVSQMTIDVANVDFQGNGLTDIVDVALASISSEAGTTVTVTLGTDAGDEFLVGNNNAFVVEGDNDRVGIGTTAPNQLLSLLGTNGQISIEESDTEFLRIGVGETSGQTILGFDEDDVLIFGEYTSPSDTTINEFVRIDAVGNVGIGTSPSEKFHVFLASGDLKPIIETNGGRATLQLDGVRTSDSVVASLVFLNAGDSIAGITADRAGANDAGSLNFSTQPTGGSSTNRVIIDSTGNVGIGTVSPDELLHVSKSTDGNIRAKIENANTGTSASALLEISADAAGIGLEVFSAAATGTLSGFNKADAVVLRTFGGTPPSRLVIATGSSIPIHFSTNDTAAMTIDSSQQVGIGTEAPNSTLDVDGAISGTDDATTLGAAATTFAVTSNFATITGDGGGNTIATITGGTIGQTLILLFVDGNVTITDDNTHAADSVDLSAALAPAADDLTLSLISNGTSWYETGRSPN